MMGARQQTMRMMFSLSLLASACPPGRSWRRTCECSGQLRWLEGRWQGECWTRRAGGDRWCWVESGTCQQEEQVQLQGETLTRSSSPCRLRINAATAAATATGTEPLFMKLSDYLDVKYLLLSLES